jgi:hypothetical protein
MYKGASRFQVNRGNPVHGVKIEPRTSRDEARVFASDFIFYEHYLSGLNAVSLFIINFEELNREQRQLANQLKKLCSIEKQGFELLEKIKSANESSCEAFLKAASPMLLEISNRAIEANSIIHIVCKSFPSSLVGMVRGEVHAFMLKNGQKMWPGKDVKSIKKMYAEYGIE